MKKLFQKEFILIIIAIILGLLVGLLAVFYAGLVDGLEILFHKKFTGSIFIIFIPALGGLLVGLLIKYEALSAKGHGVPAILETIKTKKVHFTFRDLWIEGFASALTIGSGGSAGRIGPVIEIGTGLGDLLAQKMNYPIEKYQTMLGCGAAAGISAIFNAPIGGIVFVMEVLFRDLKLKRLSFIIISAVSADILIKNIFSIEPIFTPPDFYINSLWEYIFFIILGAIMGLLGFLFVKVLFSLSTYIEKLDLPFWLKPTLGGLIVGITGYFLPQIMGTGIGTTNEILNNGSSLVLLSLLIIFKIIMTSITLSSGGSGGIFAPTLMIGGLSGVVFASVNKLIFPDLIGSLSSYGIVGMAAAFSGLSQAPLTAALIIFELTGDYNIIVPLLSSAVIASTVYNKFISESIYSPDLFKRLTKL